MQKTKAAERGAKPRRSRVRTLVGTLAATMAIAIGAQAMTAAPAAARPCPNSQAAVELFESIGADNLAAVMRWRMRISGCSGAGMYA